VLNSQEELRLYSAIPNTFDVTFDGSTQSYTAEKWWENQDHDISYPEVSLGWNAREVEKEDEQPLNQIIAYDLKPNEPTIDVKKASKVYDELVVKCSAANGVNSDGVPGTSVAQTLTNRLFRYFKFRFDQNSEGTNGERPVLGRVVSSPVHASELVDGDQSESYQFTVRLHYSETIIETVDSIDDVNGSVNTSGTGSDFNAT
jgi:hypothetical protein